MAKAAVLAFHRLMLSALGLTWPRRLCWRSIASCRVRWADVAKAAVLTFQRLMLSALGILTPKKVGPGASFFGDNRAGASKKLPEREETHGVYTRGRKSNRPQG